MAKKKAVVPTTQFRPLHDYIVIKRPEKDIESEGGILLAVAAREDSTQGTVLAIGPGFYDEMKSEWIPITGIKVGDTVLFAKKAGHHVKSNGEEVSFLKAKEVIAVVA